MTTNCTVYTVFRFGVYHHNCYGIFFTQAQAESLAKTLADNEPDNYHLYVVEEYTIGTIYMLYDGDLPNDDRTVASFSKKGKRK